MKLFKNKIIALARERNLTQNGIARLINVGGGSLSNALSGRRHAGRKLLAGLLRLFPDESVASLTEGGESN